MELNGPEAKEAFTEKVRRRLTCGMPVDAGSHSHATAWAWAYGYEQALQDVSSFRLGEPLHPTANQPGGHYFVDTDGDGLCDYRTRFDALESRCLNAKPGHRTVFVHNDDSDGKGMAGGSGR